VPEAVPAIASRGKLEVDLNVKVERQRGEAEMNLASASGSARLADLALAQRGAAAPFLTAPRLTVSIKAADAVARSVRLGTVALDNVTVRGVRNPEGNIDLLALAKSAPREPARAAPVPPATPGPGAGGPVPLPPPGRAAVGAWRLSLDRFSLTRGTATFEDQATSPATTLAITDLDVTAERITWPSAGPATLSASMTMPGGGKTEVKAQAVLDPLDAQIRLATRDAPLEPFQAYFPFPARFFGFLSGDSVNEIKREQDGRLLVASRGTAWGRDLEVRAPGATSPVARLAQIEIKGIDFSWPNYALVERVTLTRPHLQIERDAQGAITLRKLFEPSTSAPAQGAAPAAAPRAGGPGERKPDETKAGQPTPNLLRTMVLDFREIALEDGYARFIDRTTTPDFSEDISKLTLTIRDLSNTLGRQRTTMSVQALVGGDSALDMRGELSGIGESLRADLVGELRDFRLASANPYAESLTSWIIQRGRLTTKVHYRIEGDRLIAEHDVNLGGLQVQSARESDEAKRRIGLPLGLAVALLKDSRGNIDFKIPLDGRLSDRKFKWGEAMWAAIKQVIGKVLAAPFNAIGRLFTGEAAEEGPQVNPVAFAAGSSVVSPSMETHLTRVADFLRRSPYVTLSLTPVVTGADVASLKSQALMARIRQFRQERKIDEFPAAAAAYYKEQNLPGESPASSEEQLARLLGREPVPERELQELIERRVEATRNALTRTEGIQAERLKIAAAQRALDKRDEGRVEFAIGAE
jgi:hypothetical protein